MAMRWRWLKGVSVIKGQAGSEGGVCDSIGRFPLPCDCPSIVDVSLLPCFSFHLRPSAEIGAAGRAASGSGRKRAKSDVASENSCNFLNATPQAGRSLFRIAHRLPCVDVLSCKFFMPTLFVTSTANSGPGSLRDTIAAAQSGDTIAFNLPANSTITLTSRIEIPGGKNLTIDGAGAPGLAISGGNTSQIFRMNANGLGTTDLVIRNLTLRDAYTNNQGGAILAEFRARVTVDNVQFLNNTADRGGSAIYSAWETNLTVLNSRFEGNRAIAGNDERGSTIAFVSPGQFTVRNSDFINNRGINGAALNSLNGKLTIENSRFINNDTLAAFYDTGKLNPFLRGFGGAIYTDRASSTSETSGSIRITGSTFEGNRGKGEGGAAYLFTAANQDTVLIEDSLFRNNQVQPLPGGNGGNGGAIVQISNGLNRGFTLRNTTIADNSATSQGGGLWIFDAPTTISNSTISGNRAGAGGTPNFAEVGGGMTIYNGSANISNTTFANNSANWVGGAITTSNVTPSLRNTLFSGNTSNNPFGIQQTVAGNFVDNGGNVQSPLIRNDARVFNTIRVGDPRLNPLQVVNGALVHTLQSGSVAIDAGTNTGITSTDQTGASRPQDGDFNGSSLSDAGSVEMPGVPSPELDIQDGATALVDGSTASLNVGTALVGGTLTRSFTLFNRGSANLDLISLALPTNFSLVGVLPTAIAANSSTSITVQVDTSSVGTFTGQFSLVNSDSDENPFNFAITARVKAANTPPTVTSATPDQTTVANVPFQYGVPSATFSDVDGDLLSLSARLSGGAGALPSWLTFNPSTGRFNGNPTAANVGSLSIDLIADDGFGGTVTDTFVLTINPAPIAPINGSEQSDTINGTNGRDRIFGLGGQDIIYGNLGDDDIWGGNGHDRLHGGAGNDELHGESGNDILYGDDGNDLLYGELGDDQLFGGAGDDLLYGGLGNDVISGGTGRDTFTLAFGQGVDTIRDFKVNEDFIGLANGLTYGQLSIVQRSSQAWITDTTTNQLLARFEGTRASDLIAQSATLFVAI
jgi:predicted outer membrane repeat protein